MIGASLNCRGVGKKGMSVFLTNLIRDQMLDFVGLQETIKKDYSQAFFRRIDPLNQFTWKWSPSVGRAGGILGGFRASRFDVCDTEVSRYMVKVVLWDQKLQKKWCMINVYGAAQEKEKEEFLTDFSRVCSDHSLPLLVGGDFNILRFESDKNKKVKLGKWSDLFNSIIHLNELREIKMTGGQYTWSNNQAIPTLEKLDRFLMSKDWEDMFPLTTVHKLSREMSDHCPLILDTMEAGINKKRDFRFDKRWVQEETFLMRVSKIWRQPVKARNSLEAFQCKLKKVKKDLKGWGANLRGTGYQEKEIVID